MLNMATSHITVGLSEEGTVASKIMRPPGGTSSIFCEDDAVANPAPSAPSRPYRMASSFELGDEQPTTHELLQQQTNRRRSKPSVNPLTGELVGCYGNGSNSSSAPSSSNCSDAGSVKEDSPPPQNQPQSQSPPPSQPQSNKPRGRIPPGGYSTPLW